MPRALKTPFESNSVWLFRNIHTNQVIFSLKRVIPTNSIEQQFPVPLRRMFPTTLRKDHWIPLVHAIFPTHLVANHIYKRLLDHRAWRLTSPPARNQLDKPKKQRNQEALNQVPTAIADLAHVTQNIDGKMILNWDRVEEKNWAKEWSKNIWHCAKGFKLSRGYRLDGYKFPTIDKETRRQLGWDGSDEPPKDLREAVERHKTVWEKMHAKILSKLQTTREAKEKERQKRRREKAENPPQTLS